MKIFTIIREKISHNKKFIKTVLIFYLLMLVIYGYYIFANISSAPNFIYSEF